MFPMYVNVAKIASNGKSSIRNTNQEPYRGNGELFFQNVCIRIIIQKQPPKLFSKGVLRNSAKFTGKHLCHSLFLINFQAEVCNVFKKETVAQVFSSEFCEISKNTFSYRTPPVAASQSLLMSLKVAFPHLP